MKDSERDSELDALKIQAARQDERMEHMATKEELATLLLCIREDLARYQLENKEDLTRYRLENREGLAKVQEDLGKLRLEQREDLARFQLATKEESSGLRSYVDTALAELRLQFKNLEAKVSRWLLAHLVVEVTLLLSFLGILLGRFPPQ